MIIYNNAMCTYNSFTCSTVESNVLYEVIVEKGEGVREDAFPLLRCTAKISIIINLPPQPGIPPIS